MASARMLGFLRAAAFASAGAFALASLSAQDDLSTRDADGVRFAVQAQLAALASGDADRAFSLATPDVRQGFGTPRQFLDVLRAQYPMMHRAAAVTFRRPETIGDRVMQRVQIEDDQGSSWLVTYLLRREGRDRQWRISACVVAPGQHHVVA